MTLEEDIKHCEEVAEEHTKYNFYGGYESCDECAKEHRQLAEWLKKLKALEENDNVKEVFKCCDTCKYLNIEADDYPCDRCMHRYINQYVYDDKREVKADADSD